VGLWHSLKVRLGLEDDWDDDYYEDEDEAYDDDLDPVDDRRAPEYHSPHGSAANQAAVRKVDRGPDLDRARGGGAPPLRSVPTGPAAVSPAPTPAAMKVHIVEPKSFTEAQAIGDKYKQGTPVILNMSATPPDLAKRLLDFASGLTYGLDGGLQKVSERVFMLSPHNVEVSDAERRRLRDTGLFPE
jgi:cell division inhibitor SepF